MPASQPTPPEAVEGTKQALLDTAERLFAEQGVDRASLRAITQTAGTNLASVNYHFGSKDGLVRAVLARRLEPLSRERLELLAACPRDPEGRPEVAGVVRAFIGPPLRMIQRERGGHSFARFVLRAFSEPGADMRRTVLEQFGETIERFTAALAAALPHLSREEIHWRFHFAVGSMAHTAGLGFLVHEASGGLCDPLDVEGVIDRLTGFLVGGLKSPACRASSTSSKSEALP